VTSDDVISGQKTL